MQESVGLVDWNSPSSQTLIGVALAFVALFVGALIIELLRQRRQRGQRAAAIWNTIESIEKEKGFPAEERRVLTALIRRWAPDDPMGVITVRHQFGVCVEQEIEALRRAGNEEQFETMGTLLHDIRSRLALDFVPLGQRIYSTRELFQGQEVWLTREADKPPQWIRGVTALSNEAVFRVAPRDVLESSRAVFRPGERFRFRLFRDEDARYSLSTEFVRWDKEPPELVFLHTSDLDRIQSREHFRVRHEQTTNVGVMNAPLDTEAPTSRDRRIVTRLRGQITNISAGGFALIIPQAVPAQVLIRVTLDLELEATEPFEVDARIVGTTPLPGGRCLIRAAFYEVDAEKEEIVARYVAHRQQPHPDAGEISE